MRRPTCLFAGLVLTSSFCVAGQPASSQPAASKPVPRALTMRGVVFEDLNADGIRDEGEPGLGGMPVSDGLTIVRTPADGRFEFQVKESTRGSVFVCTPAGWRASKDFYVIADFAGHAGHVQQADIGLVRDPARNTDRFTFVQLSDTHVTESESVVATMIEDLAVVNRMPEAPTFVVTTGDLVNTGKNIPELEGYARAVRTARHPYYNVVGNHDYGGVLRDTENYELHLGPPYYSFDVGPYHFISRDSVARSRSEGHSKRQEAWIEEDLRVNGAGKRVVIFQHYIPTMPELDWWAERNAVAIFSGHWHGRRERLYRGILDVNSSTLRFGGIDRSPRGFRIIHVEGPKLRCEWRVGNQQARLEVVHPPMGGTVAGRSIVLRAIAYDTVVRARSARWRVDRADAPSGAPPLAAGDLWAEGSWSWAGRWDVPASVEPGQMRLRIEVAAADGSVWNKEGAFTLGAGDSPRVQPGEAWPFFHNDAGHRGYVASGPQPPLALAWATHIGGTMHITSPVLAHGRVYAAGSFEQSLDDCAIVSLDLVSGRQMWRAPVDSSIKHSLAAWEDSILGVSQAGTLYCLDRDGYGRWTASMDRGRSDRWDTSFPVTDGKAVYAGRASGFGAFEFATGRPLWKQGGGGDWWPNIYSGPSLGNGTVYQGGPFVRALDPEKGDIRWANKQMAVSTVAVVPAAVEQGDQGERLYVFQNEKTLLCLEGASGKQLWEASMESPDGGMVAVALGNETGTPAIGEDIVCVGSAEVARKGELQAAAMHAFDKATGKLRWRFPVRPELSPTIPYKRESTTITSSPVIVGPTVYFGASDGYLYALSVQDGSLLWKYWFAQPIASTVAVSGNTIVVGTWDGTVYALASGDVGEKKPLTAGRP